MCSSKKCPYSPRERDWNFLRSGRFHKAKKFKEMYEAWLEFPEELRGPFHGGGMDIFWNYTMNKHLHAWMNFIIWKINETLHILEQSWNAWHGMILITPHYWICFLKCISWCHNMPRMRDLWYAFHTCTSIKISWKTKNSTLAQDRHSIKQTSLASHTWGVLPEYPVPQIKVYTYILPELTGNRTTKPSGFSNHHDWQ